MNDELELDAPLKVFNFLQFDVFMFLFHSPFVPGADPDLPEVK